MVNNLSLKSGNVERISEMLCSHPVIVLLNFIVETVMQVGQPYASHEVVIAVSQNGYLSGGIISSVNDHCKQNKYYSKHSCSGKHYSASFCRKKIGGQ